MNKDEHDKIAVILNDTIRPSSLRDFGKWFSYISKELEKIGYKPIIETLDWYSYKIKVEHIMVPEKNDSRLI